MTTAFEVAKYIIKCLPVDNLKLQKLLYYSQAVHLVLHERQPLFNEAIEAWDYGPVVPPVYREYKPYGFDVITPAEEQSLLDFEEMRAVDMMLSCFGVLSGPELINQTHGEDPWKNAYKPGRPSSVINLDTMYDFFKSNLEFTEDEIKA
ncbi:MAG: DUF4065 domain-containing protein [Treponema sp.]|jgi:uncharacterized phage-associated protein|nr:DUF4065 domain-containing protein [Treponema sp.]